MLDLYYRTHPLTGAKLRPLGHRRNGSLIWPILGGSEATGETTGTGAGAPSAAQVATADAAAQQAAAGQAATTQGQPTTTTPPAQPVGDPVVNDGDRAADLASRYTPEQLASMALRYRTEAGDSRTNAKATAAEEARTALLEQLKPGLIALGVMQADEPQDPQAIAQQLAAQAEADRTSAAQTRTLQLENAVLRNATHADLGAGGVNTSRLLDSRSFGDTLAKLDPTAADFGSKVVAAMKAAVEADPSLRVTPAATRGGAQLPGGSGEQTRLGPPMSLADAAQNLYRTT